MRVGIIGTNWGRMHLGAFRAAGAEVVALCGQDRDKTLRIAREENVPLATTSVAALIAAVEVVVVAGPDSLHASQATEALAAGRPVLCEKPLTRTLEEAEALAKAAARPDGLGDVFCAVGFPYRQLPSFRALKRFLHGRTVRQLVATVRNGMPGEPQVPGGPPLGRSGDFGGLSHVLDTALWLGDSPAVWLQATIAGAPVHSAHFHAGLANGATLALTQIASPEPGIHGSWSLVGDDWEAGFTAGYVPARGGWCLSPVRVYEAGAWTELAPADEPRPHVREPWAQAHVRTAELFLAAVRGGPRQELASFADGLAVQRLLAAALESDRTGCRMDLKRPEP